MLVALNNDISANPPYTVSYLVKGIYKELFIILFRCVHVLYNSIILYKCIILSFLIQYIFFDCPGSEPFI